MTRYIPLTKTDHSHQGWRKAESMAFATEQSAVPVLLDELPHLIPTLPLALIQHKTDDGSSRYELVALLSVTQKLNLFVAPNGRWLGGYIPAEFRGYPFRLIPEPSSGRHVLCFDKDSGQLSEQPQADGEAFFDAEGNLSPSMQKVMNFLKQCEHSRQLTQNAVDALTQHGLIMPWPIKLNAGEADTNEVNGVFRIDEAALRNLNGDALKALSDANALSLAYAQLLSQHRLQALSKLYDLHARAKAAQAALSETDVEELFGAQDDTLKFNF
jgi:hypothetical protein